MTSCWSLSLLMLKTSVIFYIYLFTSALYNVRLFNIVLLHFNTGKGFETGTSFGSKGHIVRHVRPFCE